MINQIDQTINLLSTFPNRVMYRSSSQYASAVATWLEEQKNIYPQLNSMITQLRAFIIDTNTAVEDITKVKDIVASNVKYKGDWKTKTYSTGESVTHNKVDYISKIDDNHDEPPSINWKKVPQIPISTRLTKSFALNEEKIITLVQAENTPSVSVTKEVADTSLTNNDWDISTDGSNYEIEDFALETTLTPSAASGNITLALGSGTFNSDNIGMKITGNGGEAILTASTGTAKTLVDFTDTSTIASGNWKMHGLEFDASGIKIPSNNTTSVGEFLSLEDDFSVLNNLGINYGSSIILPNEKIVIAYYDTQSHPHMLILNKDNTVFLTDTEISSVSSNSAYCRIGLALLDDGNFVVSYDNTVKKYSSNGEELASYTQNNMRSPRVYIHNNCIIAVYAYSHDGIRSVKLNADLSINTNEVIIYNTSNNITYMQSAIINGNIVGVYRDNTANTHRKFSLNASTMQIIISSTTINISNSSYLPVSYTISNNNLIVCFGSMTTSEAYTYIINSNGDTIQALTARNLTKTATPLVVGTLANNNIFLMSSLPSSIYYSIIDESGNEVQAMTQLLPSPSVGIKNYSTKNTIVHMPKQDTLSFAYRDMNDHWKKMSISGHTPVAPKNQHLPVISKTPTDTTYWTDINSMTATEILNNQTVNYAISTDGRASWKIVKTVDGIRSIVRNNEGTWQYNSSTTYTVTAWVNATKNTEFQALSEAMSIAVNQMPKTQLSAVADNDFMELKIKLDRAIILYTNDSKTSPLSHGTSINYNANLRHEYAVNGTDYTASQLDDAHVGFKALKAENFRIRIL